MKLHEGTRLGSRRFIGVAVAALIIAGACGPASTPAPQSSPGAASPTSGALDQLAAAARAEGTVTIYGPPGAQYRVALVQAFETAYPGIKVVGSFGDISEKFAQVSAERTANQFVPDVWVSGTNPTVTAMKAAGFLAPLLPQLLPEVTDPKAWLQGKLWWADSAEPYVDLMFQGGVSAVVSVNTTLAKPTDFNSYWDLTDPRWKGKIVGTDVRRPGPGGVPSRFMFKNAELGAAWFTKFYSTMDSRLGSDQGQMVDQLAKGQYAVGVFLSDVEVQRAADQGLPVAIVPGERFKEGAPIGPGFGSVALMDRAPHPSAAKLYINWLLSPAGQIAWQEATKSPSLRIDISRQGVPDVAVPKTGRTYVAAGTEEFARLTPTAISDAITAGLKVAGKE